MTELCADDFAAFFEELWGFAPFPWQFGLARQVIQTRWPDALDLPTASGKTAAIDIALFHLALEAARGAERRAPLRIFFVVDRRLVVDSAYDRAIKIADRLRDAKGGMLAQVADRLRLLADDPAEPLRVVRLRGGMPKEPDWATSVAQPTIVVSTVDQVGSRLLFRGYGVSPRMAPVHAGLIGIDSLVLLDEAHLSRAFAETAKAIAALQAQADASMARRTLQVVPLSATLVSEAIEPFGLSEADRTHPELAPRLQSPKPARLVTIDSENEEALAPPITSLATELSVLGKGNARIVAVVVNRVALARAVFEAFRTQVVDAADSMLLIGRSRPLDRRRIEQELVTRTGAGRDRAAGERPLFVVATQCIEVGADLDFDALVTQLAPLDALRQRFGRLDRLGKQYKAGAVAHAVVFATKQAIAKKADDPIYGDAPRLTWEWLQSVAEKTKNGAIVRFGIADWPTMERRLLETLIAPAKPAPVLFPAYAELWAQTSPRPAVDPWPPLFLHGIGSDAAADVQIVWRGDITEADLTRERSAAVARLLDVAPPSTLEALSLPIGAARAWLAEITPPDLTDVVVAGGADNKGLEDEAAFVAYRWTGTECEAVQARHVRPGDIIVVPGGRGGCDRWGWNPRSKTSVADLSTEAMFAHRHRALWRLTADGLRSATRATEEAHFASIADLLGRQEVGIDDLIAGIAAADDVPATWRRVAAHLAGGESKTKQRILVLLDDFEPERGAWLLARTQLSRPQLRALAALLGLPRASLSARTVQGAATEDDAGGSAAAGPVVLADHLAAVRAKVVAATERAGVDPLRGRLLALAAHYHDSGKAEPRFKALMAGTDEVGAMTLEPLAKSGRPWDRANERRLSQAAGWPPGARHEAWSVRLAERAPAIQDLPGLDRDLVLHLIGAHHGHGRPFFPAIDDAGDTDVVLDLDGEHLQAPGDHGLGRVDAGICERFAALNARLGPWQLAWLEAVLRLADHAVSREGR